MKRKEQILQVSLRMFNEEGESNLSAVDIANEMDISPGNLYYHYKGKEEIVQQLFDQYEKSIKALLHESIESGSELENILAIYLVLVEQIYTYRFLYRGLRDLLNRYPGIERRFRHLLKLKRDLTTIAIQKMLEQGQLDEEQVALGGIENIAESVAMILTYLYEFLSVHGVHLDQREFMQIALKKITAAVSPYSGKLMAQHIHYMHAFFDEG